MAVALSVQALHGVVLRDALGCFSTFGALTEASILLLPTSKSINIKAKMSIDAAILAVLPNSLLSLDLKSIGDFFAVRSSLPDISLQLNPP
jgi:hypothetical protein